MIAANRQIVAGVRLVEPSLLTAGRQQDEADLKGWWATRGENNNSYMVDGKEVSQVDSLAV